MLFRSDQDVELGGAGLELVAVLADQLERTGGAAGGEAQVEEELVAGWQRGAAQLVGEGL